MSRKKNKDIACLNRLDDMCISLDFGKNKRSANASRLHRERLIKRKLNVRGAK